MQMFLELGGLASCAAGAIAAVLGIALVRLLSGPNGQRYALAIPLATAVLTGYWLLGEWDAWLPSRRYHAILYLVVAASMMGPIAMASGLLLVERWLLGLFMAIFSAWCILPTWPSLQPRTLWLSGLTAALLLAPALLEPLAKRVGSAALSAQMAVAATGITGMVAYAVSLTYARTLGVIAAALAGCTIAALVSAESLAARGICMAYAVGVGGWAFTAGIEPQRPLWGLLFAPLAPLALWLFAVGPLAKLSGIKAGLAQTTLTVLLLIAAGVVVSLVNGQ